MSSDLSSPPPILLLAAAFGVVELVMELLCVARSLSVLEDEEAPSDDANGMDVELEDEEEQYDDTN